MLQILYEDDFILAINKPHGLAVHRSKMVSNTTEFALQILRDQVGYKVFPIHRLDRKTAGVLLFAKNSESVAPFQTVLGKEESQKRYVAITRGYTPENGVIDKSLINENEVLQDAITHFNTLKTSEIDLPLGKFKTSRFSLIEAFPKTGRFHQIRKHFNHLRHPIIGDRPHGCNKQNKLFKETFNMNIMLLHAESLKISHPITQLPLKIKAPLYSEFNRMLEVLNLN